MSKSVNNEIISWASVLKIASLQCVLQEWSLGFSVNTITYAKKTQAKRHTYPKSCTQTIFVE